MARTGWHTPRTPLRRRFAAALALFAYLAAALGYPLPASFANHKDRSQPFPCQDHACGCQSAEQCWSGCCCFTPEERWAWAESHHVEPPAYAEKPSPKGWRTVRLRDREAATDATCSCCAHEPSTPRTCCTKDTSGTPNASCCGREKSEQRS